MNMNMDRLVLGSAGLGIAAIGATYLLAPHTLLAVYGIGLQNASEANLFRGAYGGMFLAFAVLFMRGAVNPSFARPAQFALLAFMGGFAVGRLASFVVDGAPHALLVAIFLVEVFYAAAATWLLRRSAD